MILKKEIIVKGSSYFLTIDISRRKYIKYKIGKESYLELPSFLSLKEKEEYIDKIKQKIKKYILKNYERINTERYNLYKTGDTISTFNKKYLLDISLLETKKAIANLKEDIIFITLPIRLPVEKRKLYLSKLINKIISQDQKEKIIDKVNKLNKLYFNQNLKSISLKNNTSNYGSCSRDNKISLSTSILTFPEDVIDYIIIHELAHTIEHNHSKKFWAIVEKIVPDYKGKKKWIKENYYKHRI